MIRYLYIFCISWLIHSALQPIILTNKSDQNLRVILYLITKKSADPITFDDYKNLPQSGKITLEELILPSLDGMNEIEITQEHFQSTCFNLASKGALQKVDLTFCGDNLDNPNLDSQLITLSLDNIDDIDEKISIINENGSPKIKQTRKSKFTNKKKKKRFKKRLPNVSILHLPSSKEIAVPISGSPHKKESIIPISPRSKTKSLSHISPRRNKFSKDSPRKEYQKVSKKKNFSLNILPLDQQVHPVSFYNASKTKILTFQVFHTAFNVEKILVHRSIQPNSSVELPACFFNDFLKQKTEEVVDGKNVCTCPPIKLSYWYNEEDKRETLLKIFKNKKTVLIQDIGQEADIPCLKRLEGLSDIQTPESELE